MSQQKRIVRGPSNDSMKVTNKGQPSEITISSIEGDKEYKSAIDDEKDN